MRLLWVKTWPVKQLKVLYSGHPGETIPARRLSRLCCDMEYLDMNVVRYFFDNTLRYLQAWKTAHTWERLFKPEEG